MPALVLLALGGFAMPKVLHELSQDQYRGIRFKPAKAIWRGSDLSFELQLFHPGSRYNPR